MQFCILLLYALYLHYAQFCVFCTCCIQYLFLHYNAFSHVHYHCIRYYAYDIIFIHLAFSAFCVCIIRRHSCCIRHMLHSSSVAFKGPSAFICISCSLHFDIYALPYHCVAFSAVAFRYQRYALRCIQQTLHTHALNCISDGLHSAPNAYVRM